MIICKKCGNAVSNKEKDCEYCGAEIIDESIQKIINNSLWENKSTDIAIGLFFINLMITMLVVMGITLIPGCRKDSIRDVALIENDNDDVISMNQSIKTAIEIDGDVASVDIKVDCSEFSARRLIHMPTEPDIQNQDAQCNTSALANEIMNIISIRDEIAYKKDIKLINIAIIAVDREGNTHKILIFKFKNDETFKGMLDEEFLFQKYLNERIALNVVDYVENDFKTVVVGNVE